MSLWQMASRASLKPRVARYIAMMDEHFLRPKKQRRRTDAAAEQCRQLPAAAKNLCPKVPIMSS